MKFFKQRFKNECQIIAIQTLLSYFDISSSKKDIRSNLPRHSYGNTIEELINYFKNIGFETEFLQIESITTDKIFFKPAILSVDWNNIAGRESNKFIPHYVVVIFKEDKLWLYDGSNFNQENIIELSFLKSAARFGFQVYQ